jgi:hypothetical protein
MQRITAGILTIAIGAAMTLSPCISGVASANDLGSKNSPATATKGTKGGTSYQSMRKT